MLESDSPRIVFDAGHPHPFETYTEPQQEVPAPSSQQFCVLDSCEPSKPMHGIPGSSYSREKDGETESRRDRQKSSREGDDAARRRWVLQETTTTTPSHPTTANTHLKLQEATTSTSNPSLLLRQSSNPKAQTLIDARLCLIFFFLSIDFADEHGCKGEVDRVVSDLIW